MNMTAKIKTLTNRVKFCYHNILGDNAAFNYTSLALVTALELQDAKYPDNEVIGCRLAWYDKYGKKYMNDAIKLGNYIRPE